MEYFCFEGDDLWNMDDDDLVKLAGQEIEKLKLAPADSVQFGFVERVHKAYPIYDEQYADRVATIRTGSRRFRTCSRSGVTVCTVTTTPTTRC